jgi:hypothetical protein
MPHFTRILALVAAFAVSVVAAPPVIARPGFVPPSAKHLTACLSARVQDLRHLRAGADVSMTRASASPARKPTHPVSSDGGAPWTTIALGLAGACLLLAVLALARRAHPVPART